MSQYQGRFANDGVVRGAKDVYVDCIDDHWIRVDDGVAWSTYSGVFKVEDGVLLSKAFGCHEFRPHGAWETARKAYAHLFPTSATPAPTLATTDLQWQHRVDPEQVDIPRYLQEAHDAGALEVTITVGDKSMTYVHESMTSMCRAYQHAIGGCDLGALPPWTVDGFPFEESYSRCRTPVLAKARVWQAEQERIAEARKVDVKIVGVR